MKKAFVALTLLMFVGSVSATVYASSNNTTVSIVKHDDKKGKKKKEANEYVIKEDKAAPSDPYKGMK